MTDDDPTTRRRMELVDRMEDGAREWRIDLKPAQESPSAQERGAAGRIFEKSAHLAGV